jgi:5-methylcytosine-specific restriction endonuclease McrA
MYFRSCISSNPKYSLERRNLYLYEGAFLDLTNGSTIYNSLYCLECIHSLERYYHIIGTEWLHRCGECFEISPFKFLKTHDKLDRRAWGYCSSCFEMLIEKASIICTICGKKTLDYTYISHPLSQCSECYTKPPVIQAVVSNNSRARMCGLPASLTNQDWESALAYFSNRCAYCTIRPYQALEHFIPIASGYGGTVASNCIPACMACNGKKGDRHPDTLDRIFPAENLARIREYLESQREQVAS